MTNLSSLAGFKSGLRIIATNTYTANDTWTKPTGAVWVRVVLCGGGGGGRSIGASGNSGGGAGAPIVEKSFPAASLGATESITVGSGGAGGTNQNNGSSGGYSAFGSLVEATGSAGGSDIAQPPAFSLSHPSVGAPPAAVTIGGVRTPMRTAAAGDSSDFPGTSGGGATNITGRDGVIGIVAGGGGSGGNGGDGRAGGATNRYRSQGVQAGNGSAGGSGTVGTVGATGNIVFGLGGGGGGGGGTGTSGNSIGGAGGAGRVYVETWG